MIADALSAYSRAMTKLDHIRQRAAAVDEYLMRLILANSMYGGSVYNKICPADTPYEDFFTQAGMTSLFAPLMREVSLIAGAQPTIVPEPQAEKTSALVSIPRETATIGDILTRAVAVDTGFSEMHTYTEDTTALADNVANVIRRVGWQFAWPVCFGSFRKTAKVSSLTISGMGSVITVVSTSPLGDSGMSDWDKLRVGDKFVMADMSATALPYTETDLMEVSAVNVGFTQFSAYCQGDGEFPVETPSKTITASSEQEGFGGFLIRKVRTL